MKKHVLRIQIIKEIKIKKNEKQILNYILKF